MYKKSSVKSSMWTIKITQRWQCWQWYLQCITLCKGKKSKEKIDSVDNINMLLCVKIHTNNWKQSPNLNALQVICQPSVDTLIKILKNLHSDYFSSQIVSLILHMIHLEKNTNTQTNKHTNGQINISSICYL